MPEAWGFPGGSNGQEPACHVSKPRFDPWSGRSTGDPEDLVEYSWGFLGRADTCCLRQNSKYFFIRLKKFLFISFGSLLLYEGEWGLLSSCAWAFHCSGFSWGLWALRLQLRSCGTQA